MSENKTFLGKPSKQELNLIQVRKVKEFTKQKKKNTNRKQPDPTSKLAVWPLFQNHGQHVKKLEH